MACLPSTVLLLGSGIPVLLLTPSNTFLCIKPYKTVAAASGSNLTRVSKIVHRFMLITQHHLENRSGFVF